MYQKYQKYFKDNKRYRYLLKYDSEREKNNYTIRIFDDSGYEKSFGGDTDFPQETLDAMLKEINVNIKPNENIMFFDFKLIIDTLNSNIGKNFICALYIHENSFDLSCRIDVIYKGEHINFNSNNIDDIKKHIEGIHWINEQI